MKKNLLSLSIIAALSVGFSGCGSDDDSTTSDITVERGKVYDATVTDANGQVAKATIGSNVYSFESTPTYPITVSEGWIDVDGDGEMSTQDVSLTTPMVSYSNVVTPITTYIADSNETIREQKLQELASKYGIEDVNDLLKVPSEATNKDTIFITNAIYEEAVKSSDHNMSKLTLTNIDSAYNDLMSKIVHSDTLNNLSGKELAVELEKELINTDLSSYISTFTNTEVGEYKDSLESLESQPEEETTPTNTSSTNFASMDFIAIYTNVSQTFVDSMKNTYSNYSDFEVADANGITCSSLGFTFVTSSSEYGFDTKTYMSSDKKRTCTEADLSSATTSYNTGNESVILGYNYDSSAYSY